jgi:hypothetical protein
MVKRYFFRLVGSGEIVEDGVGTLADSIEHAAAEAAQVVDEMRARAELPDPMERWCLVNHDRRGVVLHCLQLF